MLINYVGMLLNGAAQYEEKNCLRIEMLKSLSEDFFITI